MKIFKSILCIVLCISMIIIPCYGDEGSQHEFHSQLSYDIQNPEGGEVNDTTYYTWPPYSNLYPDSDAYYKNFYNQSTYQVTQYVHLFIPSGSQFEQDSTLFRHWRNDILPYLNACYYGIEVKRGQFSNDHLVPANNKQYIDKVLRFGYSNYDEISIYQITTVPGEICTYIENGDHYQFIDYEGVSTIDGNMDMITFELTWSVEQYPSYPTTIKRNGPDLEPNDLYTLVKNDIGFLGYLYLPSFSGTHSNRELQFFIEFGSTIYHFGSSILHRGSMTNSAEHPTYISYRTFNIPAINAFAYQRDSKLSISTDMTLFYNTGYSKKPREELDWYGSSNDYLANDPYLNAFYKYVNIAFTTQNMIRDDLTYSVDYITDGMWVDYRENMFTSYQVLYKIYVYDECPYYVEGDDNRLGYEYIPQPSDARHWFDSYMFTCGLIIYYKPANNYSFIQQSTVDVFSFDFSQLYMPLFIDYDGEGGWLDQAVYILGQIFSQTIPAVLNNCMVWIFLEAPIIGNLTKGLTQVAVEVMETYSYWITPFDSLGTVSISFFMTIFILVVIGGLVVL